jgi:hypothetical protein
MRLVDRLERARRYAADACQIARQARRRAEQAHDNAQMRRERSHTLIEKGEAALACSRPRRKG